MNKQITPEWIAETLKLIEEEWDWSGCRDRLEMALDEIKRLRATLEYIAALNVCNEYSGPAIAREALSH